MCLLVVSIHSKERNVRRYHGGRLKHTVFSLCLLTIFSFMNYVPGHVVGSIRISLDSHGP